MVSVTSVAAKLDALEMQIRSHECAQHSRYVIPHETLGWTICPHGKHHTFPYTADANGYRTIPFAPRSTCSQARIGFFGDSFIHGDEVSDEDAALSQLQLLLDGVVINGGVPGYGTDQALMRLEASADALCCTWLLLGIATCDETRNINILRLHHSPLSAIPYMKPRFVEIAETLGVVYPPLYKHRSLREHYLDDSTQKFLAEYDAFYPRELTLLSQLSGIFSLRDEPVPKTATRQNLARKVTLKIVERFWRVVQRRRCRGTLVLIPNSMQLDGPSDLDFYRTAFLGAGYETVDLAHAFRARGYRRFAHEELWRRNGHFAPLSSIWVAETLAEYISGASRGTASAPPELNAR
jgi:hypothetical protein